MIVAAPKDVQITISKSPSFFCAGMNPVGTKLCTIRDRSSRKQKQERLFWPENFMSIF